MNTATGPSEPLRVTLVIGSNRHGRFGPVVADWLLGHLRDRADLLPQVVDVAETSALPTTLARDPEATQALPDTVNAAFREIADRRRRAAAVERMRQMVAEGEIDFSLIEEVGDTEEAGRTGTGGSRAGGEPHAA